MAFWIRKNGGNWNNDPSADPVTNTGGYALTNLYGIMAPVAVVDNSTTTFNFGASSFTYTVPDGFSPGWPNAAASGWTSFDPTTLEGDCSIVPSTDNLQITSGDTIGFAFAVAADAIGFTSSGQNNYYWEFTVNGTDLFTDSTGGGICAPGADIADGVGAIAKCGDLGGGRQVSVTINAVNVSGDLFPLNTSDTFSIAVTLEAIVLTGAGGTGEAGAITVSTQDFAMMAMTGLSGIELYQSPGDNNLNLRWSDDGGNTWGNPLVESMGAAGAYRDSLLFQSLGYSRDRVFELSWASDGQSALSGIFITFERADS